MAAPAQVDAGFVEQLLLELFDELVSLAGVLAYAEHRPTFAASDYPALVGVGERVLSVRTFADAKIENRPGLVLAVRDALVLLGIETRDA